jgi:DNA-binding NtrC family response regulator
MPLKVLIVEDEKRMRQVMTMQLSDLPVEFVEAKDGNEAIELFDRDNFSLVITDLDLPKLKGMEVLKHIKAADAELPVIIVTAYGSIENAVDAIRKGAFDYVTKPFKKERLRACVEKALKISRLVSEVRFLREEIEGKYNFDNFRGQAPEICHILNLAGDVAKTDSTVLITGESGTGKELLGRAIHLNSNRATGPFLPINCAAIPSTLLESELFGYEEGAFTGADRQKKGKFEQASGGTLFLDEIGDMAVELQARLLRVLETRNFQRLGGTRPIDVNVRILSATNKDLKQMVAEKTFREDLYYRINVFPIHIPPLREHREDILLLVEHFIREFSSHFGRTPPKLNPKAGRLLERHSWKGNIRELKNVIERAMILCKENELLPAHLFLQETRAPGIDPTNLDNMVENLLTEDGIDIEDLEVKLLQRAVSIAGKNISKAARLLGLSRATLRYRLEKHNINPEDMGVN